MRHTTTISAVPHRLRPLRLPQSTPLRRSPPARRVSPISLCPGRYGLQIRLQSPLADLGSSPSAASHAPGRLPRPAHCGCGPRTTAADTPTRHCLGLSAAPEFSCRRQRSVTADRRGRGLGADQDVRPCRSGRSARFKAGARRPGAAATGPARLAFSSDWVMGACAAEPDPGLSGALSRQRGLRTRFPSPRVRWSKAVAS